MKTDYQGKAVPESIRRAAVQKMLTRGSRRVEDIAKEVGFSTWTLYHWARRYGNGSAMKTSTPGQRPQDRSTWERIRAVVEYEGLKEDERGEYLRKHGLHSETVAQWREWLEKALSVSDGGSVSRHEASQLRAQNKELERELHRKDKALAETTALLVLQKKAQLLWGSTAAE